MKRLLAAALLALLAGFAIRSVTAARVANPTHASRSISFNSLVPYSGAALANQAVHLFVTTNTASAFPLSQAILASFSRTTQTPSAHAAALNLSSTLLDVPPTHQVGMTLTGSSQANLSDPIMLSGTLDDQVTGEPVANKTISFSTNGMDLGQTHTDDQGIFTVQIHKDLPAGTYQVIASFKGAHLLDPTSRSITIQILPAIFQVQTVPAVPGITFQVDGRQFISDAKGIVSINFYHIGDYALTILLDLYHNSSQRVEFGRWADENYQPEHVIHIPGDYSIQVGLNIFHQVSMNFVDLDGLPVDASRISAISIRSVQGDIFTLKPGDQPWLPASRTARRQIGLEVTNLLYSVNSVIINGSNVVNSAQQRFYVKPDDTWNISLLLYSMHITTKDGLFASPVGQSVNVTFPDGQVQNYPLNGSGSLDITSLPRGIYHISLPGVSGLGTGTPVALSRNQVVNLRVVTILDIVVIGFLSISLALGLIFYGRPWLLSFLFRRKRTHSPEATDVNP
jgi:hypothetical protein